MSDVTGAGLVLPPSIADVEPVQSMRAPASISYNVVASGSNDAYLKGFAEGKILGQKCPVDGAIYVPPRGICPVHGVITSEVVELVDTAHLGSFCITRIPIKTRPDLTVPYVAGWIHLDGAAVGFIGLVAGCEPEEVRMGMRLRAKWQPQAEWGPTPDSILWWEPTGEPDVPIAETAGADRWDGGVARA